MEVWSVDEMEGMQDAENLFPKLLEYGGETFVRSEIERYERMGDRAVDDRDYRMSDYCYMLMGRLLYLLDTWEENNL